MTGHATTVTSQSSTVTIRFNTMVRVEHPLASGYAMLPRLASPHQAFANDQPAVIRTMDNLRRLVPAK